jgi:hypothetical protein
MQSSALLLDRTPSAQSVKMRSNKPKSLQMFLLRLESCARSANKGNESTFSSMDDKDCCSRDASRMFAGDGTHLHTLRALFVQAKKIIEFCISPYTTVMSSMECVCVAAHRRARCKYMSQTQCYGSLRPPRHASHEPRRAAAAHAFRSRTPTADFTPPPRGCSHTSTPAPQRWLPPSAGE